MTLPYSTADSNSAFGAGAGFSTTTGTCNTTVGHDSGASNVTGSFNANLGNAAGQYTKGGYNTCVGASTGQLSGDGGTWSYSTALGYGATNTASNQIVLGTASETVSIPGVFRAVQSADPFTTTAWVAAPTFSILGGMVYSIPSTGLALTSLSFTNIPITPLSTHVFTFIIQPGTANSAWYFKPPTNYISVTAVGGTAVTTVALYGLSNVVLPSTYTYLVQTITIVNSSTSPLVQPSLIAFVSVSGY